MKKRIAFLLIVPLLCVLAASLNISYMLGLLWPAFYQHMHTGW